MCQTTVHTPGAPCSPLAPRVCTIACPRCCAVLAERASVFLAHGDATTRTIPDGMGVRAVPERPRGSPRVTPDKECVRMTITVEAISEAGVLKPLVRVARAYEGADHGR